MMPCDQHTFSFFKGRELTANFNGGDITSDAGLLPLGEFDDTIGFSRGLSDVLRDRRDERFVDLALPELMSQRLYQLVAGYEDGIDSNRLRHDPTIKAIAGRLPEDDPLGSQSTISRLENRVTSTDCLRFQRRLVDTFVETRETPPHLLTLDIDPTKHETYGGQQLTFFKGYYGTYMYFPMLIYEANSCYLLAAALRGGDAGGNTSLMQLLPRLVGMLRDPWPHVPLEIRGDGGIGSPQLYTYCEENHIDYYLGLPGNSRLKKLSEQFVKKAEARFKKYKRPQKRYTSFRYQADTWECKRRVVVKVEVTAMGTNVRYVLTNVRGPSNAIYRYFVGRCDCENHIDELKNGFSHKMSCQTFVANQFRLLMHAAAYNLTVLFRERLKDTELGNVEIDTMRTKLFKVGAVVRQTTRRIWFELSSSWPYRELFLSVSHTILIPCST